MSEPNVNVVPTCEATIKSIVTAAKSGHVTAHEKTDEKETWTIQTDTNTYMVENISRKSRTGRDFNKTNLKQLNGEEWKTVNLGDWKKKLFYTSVTITFTSRYTTNRVSVLSSAPSILKKSPSTERRARW